MSGRDFFDKGPTEQQLEELRKKAEQIAMTQPNKPGPSWEKEAEEKAQRYAEMCHMMEPPGRGKKTLLMLTKKDFLAGARWAKEKAAAPGEESWEKLKGQLEFVIGHSNCYCDECKAIARDCWSPSNALANALHEISSLKATEAALHKELLSLKNRFDTEVRACELALEAERKLKAEVQSLREDLRRIDEWARKEDTHLEKENEALRQQLAAAKEALEYVKHRTEQCPERGMHPHGFIRSTRMRGVILDALAKLKAPSDAGEGNNG